MMMTLLASKKGKMSAFQPCLLTYQTPDFVGISYKFERLQVACTASQFIETAYN